MNAPCRRLVPSLTACFVAVAAIAADPGIGASASANADATASGPVPEIADGPVDAVAIMDRVLRNRPEDGFVARGILRETSRGRTLRRLRIEASGRTAVDGWRTVYRIRYPAEIAGTALLVVETGADPARYILHEPGSGTRELAGDDLLRPFAGTQFSMQDFGFDFVRWADQRFVEFERSKGLEACVIESRPEPGSGNPYGHVVSWIARSRYAPLRCEAYDQDGEFVRRIEVRSFDANGPRKLEARGTGDVRTILDLTSIETGYAWDADWYDPATFAEACAADRVPIASTAGEEVVDQLDPTMVPR